MSAAEITEYLNLTSIKDHGWHIQPCCGVSGDGYAMGSQQFSTIYIKLGTADFFAGGSSVVA